jgi:MFS family permease
VILLRFTVFGMSQFLFQTPAGYLFDRTERKIAWLSLAAVSTTLLTIFTAVFATKNGGNLTLMVLVKVLQGAVTSFIPPGLNSITQGIVGGSGMTEQVAVNEMMNHFGTSCIVLIGSLLGFALYPSLGILFVVSPIFCVGVLYSLSTIPKDDIDHAAARGVKKKEITSPSMDEYAPPDSSENEAASKYKKSSGGWQSLTGSTMSMPGHSKADSPFKLLRDPVLLTFIFAIFLFGLANGTVLPLVMQTLALGSGSSGFLMSGLSIMVGQIVMALTARICGEYSGKYGRKKLFLVGLFSLPIRCLVLWMMIRIGGEDGDGSFLVKIVILSTQILDGIGAGVFGTMYILVTSDLSQGTGRFSFALGLTTAAMSIGGTVSGYLGEALAEDLGYEQAFFILMIMALAPASLFLFFMPVNI